MINQGTELKNAFERNPKKTATILISIFILLIEIGLQGYFFSQNKYFIFNDPFKVQYIQETHDERGYALKKNYHDERYHINRDGYRGEVVEGDPDILMLGDSVPFGSGSKDDQTYPYILGKRYGLKVLNGGVPSYSLRQALLRWQKDFKEINPKVVTVHDANDAALLFDYQDKWNPDLTWLKKRWFAKVTIVDRCFGYSAIYYYVKNYLTTLLGKNDNPIDGSSGEEEKTAVSPELENRFLGEMAAVIDDFIRYSIKT